MATFDLDNNQSTYQVRSYTPGRIQINDSIHTTSLIVSPHCLIENWTPQTANDLTADSLAAILKLNPSPTILLIGTGHEHIFIPVSHYGQLINLGIGVEIMDTSAACRTFNALSAENRQVAAALIIR